MAPITSTSTTMSAYEKRLLYFYYYCMTHNNYVPPEHIEEHRRHCPGPFFDPEVKFRAK